MATKNFSFSLAILSCVLFIGCQTFERRNIQKHEPIVISQGTETPTKVAEPPPPSPTSVLPVGIYFGPGAMRSYAQVGILRALSQAHIPIVAVGGEEWGAVVAALYGFSKSVNDVEWQMLKLRKEYLPMSHFLKKEVEPQESEVLNKYFKLIFGDKNLETAQVPFLCSTSSGNNTLLLKSGKASEQLTRCVAMEPFYTSYKFEGARWTSGVLNPSAWAEELIKAGAKFTIYVDIMGEGPLVSKTQFASSGMANTILSAVRSMSALQAKQANLVIKVPVFNDILDFENRREMMKAGERFGSSIAPEIQKAVGL